MKDSTRHVSALELDALALGAVAADTEAASRAHLASCAVCRTEAEAAAALREQFERSPLSRKLPTRRRRMPPWVAVPILAAGALMFVATRYHPTTLPELASKGGAAWQVVANRNGETFAVHDGTSLMPGDRLRFIVLPNGAHFVMIASIDGAGTTTIYYPYGGAASAEVHGERAELPGSIVLDAAPGPERLFVVLSDGAIAATTVRAELAAIGADPDKIRGQHQLNLPMRAQLSLVFEKVTP